MPTRDLAALVTLFVASGFAQAQASPLAAPQILGTPLRRLDGLPLDAVFTRDGSLLLTSCLGPMAQVWDPRTGKRVAALTGKGAAMRAWFCGAKDERIAAAFQDDGVRLFEARTGKAIASTDRAVGLAVSPDGTTVATTKGEDLLLLDPMTWKPKATIKFGGTATTLRFTDDGKQVVVTVASKEKRSFGTDKVVDLAQKKVTGEQEAKLELRKQYPLADGKTALRGFAMSVQKISLADDSVLATCKLPIVATSLAVLKDGAEVIVGDNDGRMVHAEFATGNVLRRWGEHNNAVTDLTVSPDGTLLVSMSWDQTIRLWNLADGKELFPSPTHNNVVTSVAFAADGKQLASGGLDNSAILWGSDGKLLVRHAEHEYAVIGVAAGAAGLWSASQDRSLRLTDAAGKEVTRVVLDGKYAYATAMTSVAADGTLITGHRDGTVQWRDGKTGAELRRGDFHTNAVKAVACDATGTQVVSGGGDGHLVFWDVAAATSRKKVAAHEDGVAGVCIGPGGQAFSCGEDGALAQWDVATGESVRSVTIDDDGKPDLAAVVVLEKLGLVVAAGGGVLHCRKLGDLAPAGTVALPAAAVSLAVSADGTQLAAGLEDGTVALFAAVPAPAAPAAPAAKPSKPAAPAPTKPKK